MRSCTKEKWERRKTLLYHKLLLTQKCTRWWFQTIFFWPLFERNWSHLTCAYFSNGWFNHQLVYLTYHSSRLFGLQFPRFLREARPIEIDKSNGGGASMSHRKKGGKALLKRQGGGFKKFGWQDPSSRIDKMIAVSTHSLGDIPPPPRILAAKWRFSLGSPTANIVKACGGCYCHCHQLVGSWPRA